MLMGVMVLGAIGLRARSKPGAEPDPFSTGGDRGMAGWYVVLGLIGVVVLGLTMLVDVFAVFGRVESLVTGGGSHAAGIRLAVWKLAAAAWRQAPAWGTGWGSFLWATQPVIGAADLSFVTHAESDYVQILPEGGLIGSAIALLGLFGLFRCGFGLCRDADRATQYMLAGGAASGLAAVAWGALTENVLRTPGVVIPALVTAAHVARLDTWKRRERKLEAAAAEVPAGKSVAGLAGGLVLGAVLTAAAWPNVEGTRAMSRAWSTMRRIGIMHAGVRFPDWSVADADDAALERERSGTEAMENLLPGWGDYHVRRAVAEAEGFQRETLAELKREGLPEAEATRLSRLMELAVIIRGLPPQAAEDTIQGLLADPIVRKHLIPAARSLTYAWRSQPSTAMVHLELAILDWLFVKKPPVEESLRRGVELAGNQAGLLIRAGQIASALGDEPGAVRAFGKALAANQADPPKAERIRPWLSAGGVDRLAETSANGAVLAGELLMDESDTARRGIAGRRALEKLGEEQGLENAEIRFLRARAQWLAGEREKAIETARIATAYSPKDRRLRFRLVEWLIASGQTARALEESRVLGYFWPGDTEVERLISRAAEADAAGGVKGGSGGGSQ